MTANTRLLDVGDQRMFVWMSGLVPVVVFRFQLFASFSVPLLDFVLALVRFFLMLKLQFGCRSGQAQMSVECQWYFVPF